MKIESAIKSVLITLFIIIYFWWFDILFSLFSEMFLPMPIKSYSNIDVVKYFFEIELVPSRKMIKANNQIVFIANKSEEFIKLDFSNNYTIKSLELNGKSVKYDFSNNILKVNSAFILEENNVLKISYYGHPSTTRTFGLVFSENNKPISVYTINEPSFARTWFPCSDKPYDKALVEMKIINDSNYTSVSNGNLIAVTKNGDKKTFHWESEYPVAPYYISIYSSYYKANEFVKEIKGNKYLIKTYLTGRNYLNGSNDFFAAISSLDFLCNNFGAYPFISEKIGLAEINWEYGAIENQTAIGVGNKFITGDSRFLSLYVHELAHAWFGNSVGIKSWKDIWVVEGFASYAEIIFAEEYFKNDKTKYLKILESFSNTSPVSPLFNSFGNPFDRFIYEKGARVFLMLENEIGKEKFRTLLKQFFEDYKFNSITTQKFQSYLENKIGKSLKVFFEQWIYRGVGLPKMNILYKIDNSTKSNIELEINQLQTDYRPYKYPLEISFVREDKNESLTKTYYIKASKTIIKESFDFKIAKIIPDPNRKLLAQFIIKR